MTPLPEQYRPLTLTAGIHLAARRSPDKPAVREGARSLSYGELSRRIEAIARGLLQRGLQRGDRVAVLAPNCLEYPELVCGIADAGLVAVTVNPRAHPRELAELAADSRPRLVFVHPSLADVASAAPAAAADPADVAGLLDAQLVIGAGYEAWRDTPRPALPLPALTEFDPLVLVYTSGTTGRAKGLLLPHRARTLLFLAKALRYQCYGPQDSHLCIAPMALGAGFGFGMCALYFGGFLEILPAFDAQTVLYKLSTEPFTSTFVVPSHLQAMLDLPRDVLDACRDAQRSLKAIVCNAAALPYPLKQRTIGYFGAGLLHETYGFTEAGIVTNLPPEDQLRKPGSVGRPFPLVDVRLFDDDGQAVAPGEVGEIHVSSPYLFNGYWNRPEDTAACTRNGFVSAGDLARQDEDGCFYIVDRRKDMVVSGGINLYPREIEDVLGAHPQVAEVAVIGLPDQRWGERLCACVVAAGSPEPAPEALMEFCRASLAGYKVPRDFRYLDALPRNTNGKVLKRVLREQCAAGAPSRAADADNARN